MMMAHDSGSGQQKLAPETIDGLRSAVAQYLDAPLHGDALRHALKRASADARAKGMLPEELLVVLKDVLYALPGVRAMRETDSRARLLQRIVTMCIKEYYAD